MFAPPSAWRARGSRNDERSGSAGLVRRAYEPGPAYVVDYVRAAQALRIEYDPKVVITADSAGTSRISQRGAVTLAAGEPRALSSARAAGQAGGTCRIDLVLRDSQGGLGQAQLGEYTYDCSAGK
ncbi:curli-like amyloid fiber formation chaperone CsgH [Paraburkholderia sp. MM5477-R1]|uniref:curli-like amyloid fiber formation chaperone CsgH n=1 Tax=Paraburkholderia sp. MM5477-R1 TaxID=2991062 RepID=UPI003D25A075